MHGFQLVSHSKCSSILYHLRDMTLSNIVTLKSRLGGHSFCKFVQDLYIAEIYRPGLSSGADSICLSSFTSTQRTPKKLHSVGCALRSFKVIQCHRNRYKSKARMRLSISLMFLFSIVSELWRFIGQKICVFSPFLPTTVSFEAVERSFSWWHPGYESSYRKIEVSGRTRGENCVILRSFVLSQYQCTHRPCLSRNVAQLRAIKIK